MVRIGYDQIFYLVERQLPNPMPDVVPGNLCDSLTPLRTWVDVSLSILIYEECALVNAGSPRLGIYAIS